MTKQGDHDKCKQKNRSCTCGNSSNSSSCCSKSGKKNKCCCSDTHKHKSSSDDSGVKIDLSSCIECGACVDACPVGAISL